MAGENRSSALGTIPYIGHLFKKDCCSNEMIPLDTRKERFRLWLAAPDPSSNHHIARQKHQQGTGKWLVEGNQFERWKTLSGSILWLHGIGMLLCVLTDDITDNSLLAGCGKSILW